MIRGTNAVESATRSRRGRKPQPPQCLRRHSITCRLTDAERADLLRGKPEGMTGGEWLRVRALKRTLPPSIPAINREAWRDLARVAGNLTTVATAMRGGRYKELDEIRQVVAELRRRLIGVNDDEGDEID